MSNALAISSIYDIKFDRKANQIVTLQPFDSTPHLVRYALTPIVQKPASGPSYNLAVVNDLSDGTAFANVNSFAIDETNDTLVLLDTYVGQVLFYGRTATSGPPLRPAFVPDGHVTGTPHAVAVAPAAGELIIWGGELLPDGYNGDAIVTYPLTPRRALPRCASSWERARSFGT